MKRIYTTVICCLILIVCSGCVMGPAPGVVVNDPGVAEETAPSAMSSTTPALMPVPTATRTPAANSAGQPDPTIVIEVGDPGRATPTVPGYATVQPAYTSPSPVRQTPQPEGTPQCTPLPEEKRYAGPGHVPVSPKFEPKPLVVDTELQGQVLEYLGSDVESYGLVIKRLDDGRGIAINADRQFYAASLFKALVMYEVYKQRSLGIIAFDQPLVVTCSYRDYQLGDVGWDIGTPVPIGTLTEHMITVSNNVAAVMLLDKVGTWNLLTDAKAIGLQHTDINGDHMPTSAIDMALWMEMIGSGQAVDEQASQEMIALLSRQKVNDRIPAKLPAGTQVAHKTGNWDGATHDVGIVYAPSGAYVMAVLSSKSWESEQIAELSRLVYDHFENTGD